MTEQTPVSLSFRIMPSRLPERERAKWINENSQVKATFDTNTLFYDVFRSDSPSKIIAVGPPLQRPFRKFIKESVFRLDGQPADIIETSQSRRACTLEISSSVLKPRLLEIEHPSVSFSQAISPSLLYRYKGSRALFTLSHNNELEWIQDWARFHVETQGVEAIVLFDNASSKYGARDILQVLAEVRGLKFVDVISVPFRYGPPGNSREQTRMRFLQFGLFEIARLRFLGLAAGVLNLDIDELAFTPPGQTVFGLLNELDQGLLTLNGEWRYPKQNAPLCHASHVMRAEPETATIYPKWCLDPLGSLKGKMWRTHGLKNVAGKMVKGSGFLHCRMISTHWDYDRAQSSSVNLVADPLARRILGDSGA